MVINLRVFTVRLTLFAAALVVIAALLAFVLPRDFISAVYWWFIPFFFLVILLSKLLLNRLSQNRSNNFNSLFLMITAFRFFLYIGVLILYSFSYPEDAVTFIVTFFVFYFAFTIFEVTSLYQDLQKKNNA
ncbi:MAG: hypothetical protein R6U62_08225 [Bacteroidales bacterium]